ncbi:MAG TPA: ABC transporter ATP-binding protein [Thermoanaerobaculia bacterium]|nr:ABC transporter ATP-binding protein [Thermoanaerobaculia bacterium]
MKSERYEGRPRTAPPVVAQLRRATRRYGKVLALDGLDLSVRAGEVVAVLGPNGAGKTTAVHLLLGLIRAHAGEARLFGLDPRSFAARSRVGAMLQISKVPETLKVREHIDLISSYYPRPLSRDAALEAAGLGAVADRLFGQLSGGQRQRLLFALAVCGNPDVLFLDEPTVGLDVEARRGLWEHIRERARAGCTVFLTTHYLEEADALAHRVVLLAGGRILAEGTPGEIKARVRGRRIRCRTSLPLAEVAALPGVRAARFADGPGSEVELFADEAEATVRALLARDPGLADLEVRGADLEEAFLALTGVDVAEEVAA